MSPFHWNKTGSWVCCLADWNSTRIGYKGAGGFFSQTPSSVSSMPRRCTTTSCKAWVSIPCPELALNVPKPDIDWAESEQKRLGIQESGYILIHAGSSQLAQAKSIDKSPSWELAANYPRLPAATAGYTSGRIQEPENDQLVQKNCCSLVPTSRWYPLIPESWRRWLAANLILCTDSAPMHLAVAVQTYTIALSMQNCCLQAIAFAIKSQLRKCQTFHPGRVRAGVEWLNQQYSSTGMGCWISRQAIPPPWWFTLNCRCGWGGAADLAAAVKWICQQVWTVVTGC